ncbi:hypothetical protein PAAG_05707 [Paracoccidioides lutzii Pb01]|uniref:Uncharacterized protein n=1 Tax=Paracoccidioides lutzii (strain ATCC MYA-826 / Pb01) TaxID=502779 RepID=C1H4L4_PARBA|nr:hypothetical protein PAAG_05707 [Paracoccidioides lutzii Pb01]EEH34658.2 hypothetical protein PAAG_05707 [Paracoccidioides lutzii Pb01]
MAVPSITAATSWLHAISHIVFWQLLIGLAALSIARPATRSTLRVCYEEPSTKYLPMMLHQYANTWDPWDYYTPAMGC